MSEATYKVVDVYYRWKDEIADSDKYGVYSASIAVGEVPTEVIEYPSFDDGIFFYAKDDAEVEALYEEDNGQDFVLLKESE
jgi:hypothetical protein